MNLQTEANLQTQRDLTEETANPLEEAVALLERGALEEGLDLVGYACVAGEEPPTGLAAVSARLARMAPAQPVIRTLKQHIEQQPDALLALQLLGLIYLEREEWGESISALERAAGLRSDSVALQNKLGVAFYALKRFSEAERAFDRALQIDPVSGEVHNNLALLHWYQGNARRAVHHTLSAIACAPDDVNAHINCARILSAAGHYEMAAEPLEQFLLMHDDPAVRAELSRCRQQSDQTRRRGHEELKRELYTKYTPWILIGWDRFGTLCDLVRSVSDVPGDLAEVGVYKGGVSAAMAEMQPQKMVHGFDTFCGMPTTEFGGEFHQPGDFADTSLQAVTAVFRTQNFVLHPGRFPETAAELGNLRFAFVHIDGDYYETTRDAIDWFYPRLSPGGVLLFDDYGFQNCPGVKRALFEGVSKHGYRIEPINQQAVVRAPHCGR